MFRRNRKGYLVVSALLVVAVAMLYATATLASIKALRNESGWSQSRTQEQAAARSATAKLVSEFNQAGSMEEGRHDGEIHGIAYTANLVADQEYSNIFHLTAVVGDSEFTRVLRQEPRPLHLAFARTGPTTDPTLHAQTSLDAQWEVLPLPPERPGDFKRIPATTSNYNGELYAFRFGRRLDPLVPTPFLSKYDVRSGNWSDLPPIPFDFRQSLEERDGWTIETYARQSVLAANNDHVVTVIGPNSLVNRRAPQDVAELFIYEIERELWYPLDKPDVSVYDQQGQLRSDQDEVSIDQLVASDGQFIVEMSGSDPVSTLFRFKDDRWTRLPPLPADGELFGKAVSVASGPDGKISAVVGNRAGEMSLVRLVDGHWQLSDLPRGEDGVHTIAIDSEGREWLQDMQGGKLYRSSQDGWEEKTLPEGVSREVDIGARPHDELFYYQTTAGY